MLVARQTKIEKGVKIESLAGITTEYFYLEDPVFDDDDLPVTVFGIYDRVTINEDSKNRIHEDIMRILSEEKKFAVYDKETEEL